MVDLPETVVKTRAMLMLRGYTVDELFEYEDHYRMYPVKKSGDDIIKSVVWILKQPTVIGVATIKDIEEVMEEISAQEGVLVGGTRYTPSAKKRAKLVRIELVEGTYSSFDLFQHELVPKHVIASEEEVQMVLDHYRISKSQLPRILKDDPVAKMLGAKVGQVLRIERPSETAGVTFYYRLVVDGSR